MSIYFFFKFQKSEYLALGSSGLSDTTWFRVEPDKQQREKYFMDQSNGKKICKGCFLSQNASFSKRIQS